MRSAFLAWLAATLMAALVVLLAGPASAHALLEGTTPAADAVLKTAPTSVDLLFSESVTLLPDSVRVFGPDGSQVDDKSVGHAHGDGATASVGLPSDLPQGTYLVAWRVVSADSHPISGAYTFSIGHASQAPTAPAASGGSRFVEVTLGVGRWLSYAGSALGLGGGLFLAWCWPTGWQRRRGVRTVYAGVWLLTIGTSLALLLKGPYDAGTGAANALDVDVLREVLATTYGRALDARLLLIAVLILLLTYRDRLSARAVRAGLSVLLPAVGVTFALCGHAAAGTHRALAILSDTLHVTAMSLWLGGLVMLLAVVLRGPGPDPDDPDAPDADPDPDTHRVPAPIRRFSTLAACATATLVATGTYQALREIRSWDVLFHAHYGHVLLVKLGIVAVALLAAGGSRAWLWGGGTRPVGRLRLTVGVEACALVGVLVASSLLVNSNPALPPVVPTTVSTTVKVGPDSVRILAVPDGPRGVRLRLAVLDGAGKPVEPKEVDATFTLPSQAIGPLPVTLSSGAPGVRTGHATVPLAGTWQLAVTVRTSAIDEATAYVDVPLG